MSEHIERTSADVAIRQGDVVPSADIDANLPPVNEALINSVEQRRKTRELDQEADRVAAQEAQVAAMPSADDLEYQRILAEQAVYEKELDDQADKLGNYELARGVMKTTEPRIPDHLKYLVDRDNPNSQAKIDEARDAAFAAAKQARIESDTANGIDTASVDYLAAARAAEEIRNRPASPPRY